jgi:Kelch motif
MRLVVAVVAASCAGGLAAATPLPAGKLVPGARMSTPRAAQTETALADGSVLLAGGCTNAGCELGSPESDTAEIFDPVTNRFVRVGRMNGSRDDHVAVLLRDGRVLIAGGWGSSPAGPLDTTELYDPASRTFLPGPRLGLGRGGMAAMRLRDGRVLIAGGFTGSKPTTAYAEIFDPSAGTVRPTGRMRVPRGGESATLLRDGRVLVAGGMDNGRVVASAELYDPATGRFALTGRMRIARYKTAGVTLRSEKALVIGGAADVDGTRLFASTELYDPRTGRFTAGPSMHLARYKLTGSTVQLPSGDVLVAGGALQAELYDRRAKTFRLVPGKLDHTRLFLTAAALPGGRALLAGGYDKAIRPTAATWIYRK